MGNHMVMHIPLEYASFSEEGISYVDYVPSEFADITVTLSHDNRRYEFHNPIIDDNNAILIEDNGTIILGKYTVNISVTEQENDERTVMNTTWDKTLEIVSDINEVIAEYDEETAKYIEGETIRVKVEEEPDDEGGDDENTEVVDAEQ